MKIRIISSFHLTKHVLSIPQLKDPIFAYTTFSQNADYALGSLTDIKWVQATKIIQRSMFYLMGLNINLFADYKSPTGGHYTQGLGGQKF